MPLKYISHYFDNPNLKQAFEQYARELFGLDFGLWKEKDLWDERYTAFSAFDGDRCVASMCTYDVELMVEGIERASIQLLTVGTVEAYRGKGIQRQLYPMIRQHYASDIGIFLFTQPETAGFYHKLGLQRVYETIEIAQLKPLNRPPPPFLQLDMARPDHYDIAYRLAHKRSFVSRQLGCKAPHLLLFMFLYAYRDACYYLPDLDAIVIVQANEDRLRVHDIVAVDMPKFEDLADFFNHFGKPEIEFLFSADLLEVEVDRRIRAEDDALLVDRMPWLPDELLFPYSVRA